MKLVALFLFCLNVIFVVISAVLAIFGTDSSARVMNILAVIINVLSAVNLYTKFLM